MAMNRARRAPIHSARFLRADGFAPDPHRDNGQKRPHRQHIPSRAGGTERVLRTSLTPNRTHRVPRFKVGNYTNGRRRVNNNVIIYSVGAGPVGTQNTGPFGRGARCAGSAAAFRLRATRRYGGQTGSGRHRPLKPVPAGAGGGNRTLNIQLGKLEFYR